MLRVNYLPVVLIMIGLFANLSLHANAQEALTSAPALVSRDEGSGVKAAPPALMRMLQAAAYLYGLDPALMTAIARVESGNDPAAVSSRGTIGVMQLMPQTAARFGVTNAADPIENLLGAARFLSYLEQNSGRPRVLPEVIAAYNAGEGAVAHYRGIPPYAETQNYVRKVLIAYLSQTPPAPNHTKSIRLPARGNYSAADAPAEEKADPFRQLELIQRGRAQAANAARARGDQAARK
jgi:soluble lytic murein transglycosylase-like protein